MPAHPRPARWLWRSLTRLYRIDWRGFACTAGRCIRNTNVQG